MSSGKKRDKKQRGKRLDRPEGMNDLWPRAKEASGWTGTGSDDAFVVMVAGSKGVAIIPKGNKDSIRNLADGFSVMAKCGSLGVKMIEVEEVEVFNVAEDRFMISGGGVSLAVHVEDNVFAQKFLEGRVKKGRKLRLVLSLSDFHK
jgi:hypothetical protein